MVPGLALYLRGTPRLERVGPPIRLSRRKAVALLAYLATTGESHRRVSLVNLLWPEVEATRGRAALRRTLHALRRTSSSELLDVDRDEIGLRPKEEQTTVEGQKLWVDVDHFRYHLSQCETHAHAASQVCPACIDPLTKAVGLVLGEFLSGFGVKDSCNFDDWQLLQVRVLRREMAEALLRLAHCHSTQRDFEAELGYTRRQRALDPLDESAHRQLMRLYAWSDRRSSALRPYEACMASLEDQLGVTPQDATTQLHHGPSQLPGGDCLLRT